MSNLPSIKQDASVKILPIHNHRAENDADLVSTEDLEAFQNEIVRYNSKLEIKIDDLEPRTSTLEKITQKLSSITSHLRGDVDVLNKRTDTHARQLDMIEPSIDNLEGIAIGLTAKTDRLDRSTRSLDERLRFAEGNLDNLQDETQALRQTAEMLLETDESQAQEIEALTDRFEILEPAHAELQTSHNRLSAQVLGLEQRTERMDINFHRGAWTFGIVAFFVLVTAMAGYYTNVEKHNVLVEQVAQQQTDMSEGNIEVVKTVDAIAATVIASENLFKKEIEVIDRKIESSDKALDVINQRIYASDKALIGASIDFSTINDANWLSQQNPENYIIQIASGYSKRTLADFISRYADTLKPQDFAWFKTLRNGRDWFVLVYGNYSNFDIAMKKLDSFPQSIQKSRPYIRTVSGAIDSASRN